MKYRVPFTPGVPLVARVPFRYLGVEFLPGDEFPGEKISEPVSDRRLHQLYNSRHLEQLGSVRVPTTPVEPQAPTPPPVQTPQSSPEAAHQSGGEGEYTFAHKGFGKFTIFDPTGAVFAEGLPKDVAQANTAALNLTRRGAGGAGGEAGGISAPSDEAARAADPDKAA